MDFADERYVRLYVRDTPTWKTWRWEAKALASLLLRKLDRSGRLEWPPRIEPARAVAGVVEMPIEVVESALLDMQDTETIELGPGWLEWPRFVPGQNAKSRAKSNAERTAEWKERTSYDDKRRRSGDVASPAETSEPLSCAVLSGAVLSPAEREQPAHGAGILFPPHSVESSAEAETRSSQAATPRKPRRGKAREAYPPEIEAHFLATLQAACRELKGRQDAGPREVTNGMRDSLAKLYAAERPTVDEITRVIRRRLELNRAGDTYGDLTWEHLCREAQFRKYRDAMGSRAGAGNGRVEPSARPTSSGVVDLKAAALARKNAQET